ncbi:MAG: LysM peptidoglycan-binding domain-containing protein [Pelovirga sp.]
MYRLLLIALLLPVLSSCQFAVPPPAADSVALRAQGEPLSRQDPGGADTAPLETAAEELAAASLATLLEGTAPPLSEPIGAFLQPPLLLSYAGDFPLSDHPRVAHFLERYQGAQKRTLTAWLERSGRYVPKMQLIFASEGVPLDLAYLAMIESGFNVRAYSWAHAAGPWQFIENTGRMYDLQNDWWQDDRLDLERSTRAAARHLKHLYQRFDGDWYLAIAAYNAGGGRVSQAIRASGSRDFWTLADGKILRNETIEYVPKLIAALHLIKDPQAYGFTDLQLAEPLDYEVVTVATATDLEVIAELCGATYEEIKILNPALKRWSTPPGVNNYPVRVPVGTAEQFTSAYARLPVADRARYYRHQIVAGDTLLSLAQRYEIRVDDIIALNSISNPRALKVGSNLILPLREGYSRRPLEELADSYARSRRRSYTVRQGDSLWSIARRFEVTEKQLRIWNTLGWSNLLRPGQVLLVSQPAKSAPAQHSATAQVTSRLVYEVEPGDTLWGIGRRFSVNTEQIRQWNDLHSSHVLQPGQKLTLLVPAGTQG